MFEAVIKTDVQKPAASSDPVRYGVKILMEIINTLFRAPALEVSDFVRNFSSDTENSFNLARLCLDLVMSKSLLSCRIFIINNGAYFTLFLVQSNLPSRASSGVTIHPGSSWVNFS